MFALSVTNFPIFPVLHDYFSADKLSCITDKLVYYDRKQRKRKKKRHIRGAGNREYFTSFL